MITSAPSCGVNSSAWHGSPAQHYRKRQRLDAARPVERLRQDQFHDRGEHRSARPSAADAQRGLGRAVRLVANNMRRGIVQLSSLPQLPTEAQLGTYKQSELLMARVPALRAGQDLSGRRRGGFRASDDKQSSVLPGTFQKAVQVALPLNHSIAHLFGS